MTRLCLSFRGCLVYTVWHDLGKTPKHNGLMYLFRMRSGATLVTGKPPVYVPVPTMHYLWAKLEGFGVAGISKGSGHHVHRGECITDLSRMIGGGGPSSTPLVRAPLQAWRG